MHLGKLHVLVLHFPIAMAIAAVAADILWLITRRLIFRSAGAYCLVLTLIAAIPTIVTGLLMAGSLNLTDIHTRRTETRAVLGKGQEGVRRALEEIRQALPFALRGIDSDNGSESINYC